MEAAEPEGAAAPPLVEDKEELPEKLEAEEAEQEDREIAAPEEEAEASDEEALLVVAEAPPAVSPPRGHARDVHILSYGFLLIFSAYGAVQNLKSTVNTMGFKWNTSSKSCWGALLSFPQNNVLNALMVPYGTFVGGIDI
ncbi:hypothetical protein NL676_024984 [Syzygium grande]|nr:hypothetical protein NL676_024984 [Syzygium grande]